MRFALVLLVACGPIAYTSQVTFRADDAVAAARAAHAETLSPYFWTRAVNYLRMAREVAAHADFEGATRFGRLAEKAALQATAEAQVGGAKPPPRVEIAPAK